MYYIRLSEEDPNSIVYYCRNCGHENKNISLDSVTISKTNFKHNKQKYNSIINKYTKRNSCEISKELLRIYYGLLGIIMIIYNWLRNHYGITNDYYSLLRITKPIRFW